VGHGLSVGSHYTPAVISFCHNNFFPDRELWREEAAIEQSVQNTREELNKTERNLRSTVSKVSTVCSPF